MHPITFCEEKPLTMDCSKCNHRSQTNGIAAFCKLYQRINLVDNFLNVAFNLLSVLWATLKGLYGHFFIFTQPSNTTKVALNVSNSITPGPILHDTLHPTLHHTLDHTWSPALVMLSTCRGSLRSRWEWYASCILQRNVEPVVFAFYQGCSVNLRWEWWWASCILLWKLPHLKPSFHVISNPNPRPSSISETLSPPNQLKVNDRRA